jgi:FAD/FMN-containing dehydrogenase
MGWLARQFGLACDNVARFQVVSADGELLHASESENPTSTVGCAAAAGTSAW